MARLHRVVERWGVWDRLGVVRPRRTVAQEEHHGVLSDGRREDLGIRQEGLGIRREDLDFLVVPRAELVGRTSFWMS